MINWLEANLNQWLNGMNAWQEGLLLMVFGLVVFVLSKYFHKDWKDSGYKPFKSFRRKEKTQSEDNFVIIMYMRTLLGIYVGYLIILLGLLKILFHLDVR